MRGATDFRRLRYAEMVTFAPLALMLLCRRLPDAFDYVDATPLMAAA